MHCMLLPRYPALPLTEFMKLVLFPRSINFPQGSLWFLRWFAIFLQLHCQPTGLFEGPGPFMLFPPPFFLPNRSLASPVHSHGAYTTSLFHCLGSGRSPKLVPFPKSLHPPIRPFVAPRQFFLFFFNHFAFLMGSSWLPLPQREVLYFCILLPSH